MRNLVVASQNQKKKRELISLLNDLPYQISDLSNFNDVPEVVEDGLTFEANSEKKARIISQFTGLWALADDSGLVVDALNGEPGVFSARYGGISDDHERNQYLLKKMEHVPDNQRSARFICVITLFGEGNVIFTGKGECEGFILRVPKGNHGFGYDPIFQPLGYNCSMAELEPSVKNQISHRGKALRMLKNFLEISPDR